MSKVSIITPWLDCPELIKTYERSYMGLGIMSRNSETEIIIIDNGSNLDAAAEIRAMVTRVRGIYIRNDHNAKYAAANNQGMAAATGDIFVFINNDTEYRGNITFADMVTKDVQSGALYGPSMNQRMIAGRLLDYIEGYCIAGTREDWQRIGGWDADVFVGMYWEDNDVCFRAQQAGLKLKQTNWPVWHYGNYTSGKTPGAYDNSQTNEAAFINRVSGRG